MTSYVDDTNGNLGWCQEVDSVQQEHYLETRLSLLVCKGTDWVYIHPDEAEQYDWLQYE
jgi:hypothetical protein